MVQVQEIQSLSFCLWFLNLGEPTKTQRWFPPPPSQVAALPQVSDKSGDPCDLVILSLSHWCQREALFFFESPKSFVFLCMDFELDVSCFQLDGFESFQD